MQDESFRWLRGGTGRPRSTRSFPVWSWGPLRKRTSPAERWADWDRRERVDWIEKNALRHTVVHIPLADLSRSPLRSCIHTFFPLHFSEIMKLPLFSQDLYLFILLSVENTDSFSWDLQLIISSMNAYLLKASLYLCVELEDNLAWLNIQVIDGRKEDYFPVL